MAKKAFKMPMLILSSWGGEGGDTGLGSGGTSDDFTLCTFREWLEMYSDDYSGPNDDGIADGSISFDDYHYWWFNIAGFNEDQWKAVNGGDAAGQENLIVELFPDL